MNDNISPFPAAKSRLGFHYFPDTLHYRDSDLQIWLPQILSMNGSWLVLQASPSRAIPENFLCTLIKAGIEPLLDFHLPLDNPPPASEMQTLFETYARWGVRGVLLFNQPNNRSNWESSDWVQSDLVERFLERYLPFANLALNMGLVPLFPALQPGGSYWDTAFLRTALESLERRKQNLFLENLVVTANAWTNGHSLNWGAGGPTRWKETKPYFTPPNAEDHRGFHIFDWYNNAIQSALERCCPLILLGVGTCNDPLSQQAEKPDAEKHAITNLAIAQMLNGETVIDPDNPQVALEAIPNNVLAANFWLLAAEATDPNYTQAWLQGESTLPIVEKLRAWTMTSINHDQDNPTNKSSYAVDEDIEIPDSMYYEDSTPKAGVDDVLETTNQHFIHHYLLLPTYEWGVADWHLDVIRPFVKKHSPTIGFSVSEATQAEYVTVIGSAQTFPEEILQCLRSSGCTVERIEGDGTTIATQLAER